MGEIWNERKKRKMKEWESRAEWMRKSQVVVYMMVVAVSLISYFQRFLKFTWINQVGAIRTITFHQDHINCISKVAAKFIEIDFL